MQGKVEPAFDVNINGLKRWIVQFHMLCSGMAREYFDSNAVLPNVISSQKFAIQHARFEPGLYETNNEICDCQCHYITKESQLDA